MERDSGSCLQPSEEGLDVSIRLPISSPLPQSGSPGLPFSFPGGLPNPGIKPKSLALQADSLPSEPPGKPWLTLLKPSLAPGASGIKL